VLTNFADAQHRVRCLREPLARHFLDKSSEFLQRKQLLESLPPDQQPIAVS
jgi:hypothetical protein